jgi:hypothetical protein
LWLSKPLAPADTIIKGDIKFSRADDKVAVKPGATIKLSGDGAEGEVLGLVSTLALSTDVADNTPVARLRIIAANGKTIERELRAGTDTAEWAHERLICAQAYVIHSRPFSTVSRAMPQAASYRIATGRVFRSANE